MAYELIRVRKVSEAHGAVCRDCSAVFDSGQQPVLELAQVAGDARVRNRAPNGHVQDRGFAMTLDGREVMATSRALACPMTDAYMVYVPGGGNMGAQYRCPNCKMQVRIPWKSLHRSLTAPRRRNRKSAA